MIIIRRQYKRICTEKTSKLYFCHAKFTMEQTIKGNWKIGIQKSTINYYLYLSKCFFRCITNNDIVTANKKEERLKYIFKKFLLTWNVISDQNLQNSLIGINSKAWL